MQSISAVVGSLDAIGGRYACTMGLQPSKQETISNLDGMCASLLRQFYRAVQKKPERVIFFRDGVSEGQFQTVIQEELPLLRRAFASLGDGSYNPRVTFIVVQKRHHTRLFCADPQRDADRSGNVPAGTVVDSKITHPHEHAFFIVSHAGIQGTSRPVHYHGALCWAYSLRLLTQI